MPKIGNAYHPNTEVPYSEPAEYLQGFKDNAELLASVSKGIPADDKNGYYADAMNGFEKFRADINQAKKLTFIGASIGEGEGCGSSDEKRKYSLRGYILKALQDRFVTTNYGYIGAGNQDLYVPSVDTTGNWSYVTESSSFGGGYMDATANPNNNTCKGTFRYIKVLYEGGGYDATVQIRDGATTIHSFDSTTGSGVMETAVLDMGALQEWDLRIVASGTVESPTRVYGWYYYETDPSTDLNIEFSPYVLAGMSATECPDSVIDSYCLSVDTPVITLLMYNDTDMVALEAKTRRMIDNCATNGRNILLLSTAHHTQISSKNPNDAVYRKLCSEYSNAVYLNMYDMLKVGEEADFSDGISLHPNQKGYREMAGVILDKLGVMLPSRAVMEAQP